MKELDREGKMCLRVCVSMLISIIRLTLLVKKILKVYWASLLSRVLMDTHTHTPATIFSVFI